MIKIKYILNNILRKKKQTIFSLLCLLVSSLIILTDFSLINGIEIKLDKSINQIISGRYIIYKYNNKNINILESQITDQEKFEYDNYNSIQSFDNPSKLHINKRIRLGSIVSYMDETSFINFHALEKDHLERISGMLTMLYGNIPGNNNEILISETLAEDLFCHVGDTLLLLANNVHDYMTDALGIVSGIFQEKGLALYLGYNGFMIYDYGHEIAGLDDGECLELIINPVNGQDLTKQELEIIYNTFNKNDPSFIVASWENTVPLMFAIVNVWKGGGLITQIVFILFSLIILIMLTSLMIHSRRKEFGTLLAMGFSWKNIKVLVCSEYMIIAFIAVSTGCLLLCGLLSQLPANGLAIDSEYMQYALMTDILHPAIHLSNYLYVLILFIATTILSVMISIRKLEKKKIHSLINE